MAKTFWAERIRISTRFLRLVGVTVAVFDAIVGRLSADWDAGRRAGPRLNGEAHLYGDSAYQGYDKAHPNIDYPYKKPQG